MRLILEVDNDGHLLLTGPVDDTRLCLTMLDAAREMVLGLKSANPPIGTDIVEFPANPVKSSKSAQTM